MKFKVLATALLTVFLASSSFAQKDKSERKSPPATATAEIGKAVVTIEYSQPAVKEREIFGGLVKYGKVWRTGANEATTFETTKSLMIGDKKLAPGKYSLFTIPGEKEWTIIFNSEAEQWGAYKHNADKDVLTTKVKSASHDHTEKMTISIDKTSGRIHLDWAKTRVTFTVTP